MIVDYRGLICIALPPFKANSVLVVNPDTVLSLPAAVQGFQVIPWRYPEIAQILRVIQNS
jgi:hypothetical protein